MANPLSTTTITKGAQSIQTIITPPSSVRGFAPADTINTCDSSSQKETRVDYCTSLCNHVLRFFSWIFSPFTYCFNAVRGLFQNHSAPTQAADSHSTEKNTVPATTSPEVSSHQKDLPEEIPPHQNDLPTVPSNHQAGFFVEVLNSSGYVLNGQNVDFPPAGKPEKFERLEEDLAESLTKLQDKYFIRNDAAIAFQFKDKTTEEAIHESTAHFKIALNFANEEHAGGGPGFHKDPGTGKFKYDARSARAQEESISQRSNLMASLTQLPHTLKGDSNNQKFIRSYYNEEFDSRTMAYVSSNHLFAVQQAGEEFYQSEYLAQPKAVTFITSAAECYARVKICDCSKESKVYNDAKQRIETHLLAAASSAGNFKQSHLRDDQPVELILGAFGCGAFVPQNNPDEYRRMIAEIYQELCPQFKGFFDVITFAVPTFGSKAAIDPAVINHRIFKERYSP